MLGTPGGAHSLDCLGRAFPAWAWWRGCGHITCSSHKRASCRVWLALHTGNAVCTTCSQAGHTACCRTRLVKPTTGLVPAGRGSKNLVMLGPPGTSCFCFFAPRAGFCALGRHRSIEGLANTRLRQGNGTLDPSCRLRTFTILAWVSGYFLVKKCLPEGHQTQSQGSALEQKGCIQRYQWPLKTARAVDAVQRGQNGVY